jgi:TonB family protein
VIKVIFVFAAIFISFKSFSYETEPLREQLRAAISAHIHEIRSCYSGLLKELKGAEGKIVIEFEVNDQGQLTKSEIVAKKTTLKNEVLNECIQSKFKTWVFPKAPEKQILAVTYPFVFKKN